MFSTGTLSVLVLALCFATQGRAIDVNNVNSDPLVQAAAKQYAAEIAARSTTPLVFSTGGVDSTVKPPLNNPKTKVELITAPGTHWVGDGFKVHGMFGYYEGAVQRSPFLMLDYAQEHYFEPNHGSPRGVGKHPHKGFETVTIAYQGEVSHRDTHGGGGTIGPGDCQWMTAGSGLQHEEFHSEAFSRSGGVFEMMQLWVNLPKRYKNAKPRYQAIKNETVPAIPLYPVLNSVGENTNAAAGGVVRIFAGEFGGHQGPANTFTPMNVWDVRLLAPKFITTPTNAKSSAYNISTLPSFDFPQKEGWSTLISVMKGSIDVNGIRVNAHELLHLTNKGTDIRITPLPLINGHQGAKKGEKASSVEGNEYKLLFLAGEPFDEPVVGHGPFVMNTQQEIQEAFSQFRAGRF